MRFYPLIPWLLILLGAGGVFTVLIYTWKYALELTPFRKNVLFILRCCSAAILILMLFSPGIVVREQNQKRTNVVFLIDGSESMSAADMPDGRTRFDSARETLAALLEKDYNSCGKYVYLFNHKAVPAEKEDFLEMESPYGGTHLKKAFETIDRDIGLTRVAAVAIISDGLDHSGFAGLPGLPVYAVRTGTSLANAPDLRLSAFRNPDVMWPGEEFELRIPVMVSGFLKENQVHFQAEADGTVIAQQDFVLPPNGRKEIVVRHKFEEPGLHTVLLTLNKLKGEISTLNNRRELMIEVKDEPVQPLLFFPVLTNSFRPLLRLFAQSGRKFAALYRLRDRFSLIGNIPAARYKSGLPSNVKDLMQHDVILLGTGNDSLLSEAEINILEQYVSRGGTLVVLGGDGAFGRFRSKKFSAMMPVRSDRSVFRAGNYRVEAAPDTSFGNAAPKSVPAVNLVDHTRNGASVMLWAIAGETNRYPLAVSMPYGRGRVTVMLANTLTPGGPASERTAMFRKFWEQLILQSAELNREKLRVSASSDYIPENESVNVTAVCPDAEKIFVEVLSKNSDTPSLRKALRQVSPGHFSGTLSGLSAGKKVLRFSAKMDHASLLRRYLPLSVGETVSENDDLRVTDASFLKYCPDGRLFLPGDTDRMADAMNAAIRKNDTLREWFPVLETCWFPLLLFLLLTAEWFLRRKFNMT